MMFLTASIDWFLGRRSSHMGADQYVAHAGVRDGRPTSGALLWTQAEAERSAADGNMVSAETRLLKKVVKEIGNYVPSGTSVVELGPGTVVAFRNKTLPIVHELGSQTCILVDESNAFLDKILTSSVLGHGFEIKSVVDDFFENDEAYFNGQALVCSFGSTIGNIIHPVSHALPEQALVASLSKLACAANNGWLLIGFDSDQDSESVKNYFSKHALFQLNIFDRMAVELPIEGNFDSKTFGYEAEWIATSGQLAHIAVVNRDMNFKLGGRNISLKAGHRLHIKNSYKFMPEFFEKCCRLAGLEVVEAWADNSSAKIYLLKINARRQKFSQSRYAARSTDIDVRVAS